MSEALTFNNDEKIKNNIENDFTNINNNNLENN